MSDSGNSQKLLNKDVGTSVNKDTISRDQWRTELVANLIKEVFHLIDREEETHGEVFADEVRLSFLASFVSTLVYRAFIETPDEEVTRDIDAAAESVHADYAEVKAAIENAVSSGFQGAVMEWTGGEVEDEAFVCQISLDPAAKSKMSC
jgi:hypothetical protein